MQQPTPQPPSDLRQYLDVIRRRKWSITLIPVLTLASALTFSFLQTPVYASTATVQVKPPTANLALQNAVVGPSLDTERLLVTSDAVATIAAKALGARSAASDLADRVSVSVPANSQLLEITYSDPSPTRAQRGAGAFADAYLEFKTEQVLDAVTRAQTSTQQRIQQLQSELVGAEGRLATAAPASEDALRAQADIDALNAQIAVLRSQVGISAAEIDPGDIVGLASLPTSPATPNHVRNGTLALVVGSLLGVGFAFLRERLDDRLAGRQELEEAAEAPVLAVVPRVAGWRRRERTELPALQAPKGAPAEAYRTIRTNLLFMAKDGRIEVVAVTSAAAGEGKTTTSANLAVSLAQAGKRVICVSCDLRKPRLHSFFNLNNDVGLSSVLAGKATLQDAVQGPAGIVSLRVIASGPVPTNPAELLESDRMDTVLEQLRKAADFVILDTPPALTVSDAMILAPESDGVLIVADASVTTRGAVRQVREQLEQVGGNVIGAVYNNYDPSRAKHYSSAYGYAYSYRYESPGDREREAGPVEGRRRSTTDPEAIWRTEDIRR